MKLHLLLKRISLVTLFSTLACSPLFSGTLFEEMFNYPNGNLAGNGFNSAWSGGENRWKISGGKAVITGAGGSESAISITPITSSFYFSLDLSVLEANTGSALNDSLVFQMWNGTSNVDVFGIGIAYSYNAVSDTTAVSLRSTIDSGTKTYGNFTPTVGSTNTVVGKLTFASDSTSATLTLWWNPTDETSATFRTFTLSTPAEITNISRLVLRRQTSAGNGNDVSTSFDNIRIGSDWASATTAAIPEPKTQAALMGAAMIAALAWVKFRR